MFHKSVRAGLPMTDGEAGLGSDWTLALGTGNHHEVFAHTTACRNTERSKQEKRRYNTFHTDQQKNSRREANNTVLGVTETSICNSTGVQELVNS